MRISILTTPFSYRTCIFRQTDNSVRISVLSNVKYAVAARPKWDKLKLLYGVVSRDTQYLLQVFAVL